jgi:four helix bundle protein
VSIASNIAEGSRRGSTKDFIQFLRIADGSAAELETQLIIAKELYGKLEYEEAEQLTVEVQKMIHVLIKKLS